MIGSILAAGVGLVGAAGGAESDTGAFFGRDQYGNELCQRDWQ